MVPRFMAVAALVFGSVVPCFAQIDLGSVMTSAIRNWSAPATIITTVDSVDISVEVNRGVVVTRAALKITPHAFGAPSPYSPTTCDFQPVKNDSLEAACGFHLPGNCVVTDMYLWVGQQRVRAFLQEQSLADAQYESIVRRRMDPSLVRYEGDGNYSLRIFPLSSGASRTVELEIVQGLENGASFGTTLPFMFTPQDNRDQACNYPGTDRVPVIRKMTVRARSLDGEQYSIDWGELGGMTVGAAGAVLTRQNIPSLMPGTLDSRAASPHELRPWLGSRNNHSYFGVGFSLSAASLRSGDTERYVILDLASADFLQNARQLAVLAVKAYLQPAQRANVLLVRGDGSVSPVFPSAVPFTESAQQTAFKAIDAFSDCRERSGSFSPVTFAIQRASTAGADVILLSDQQWTLTGNTQEEFASVLKARGIRLSVFSSCPQAQNIASLTGGLPLGDLSIDPASFLTYEIDNGTGAISVRLNMPPLWDDSQPPTALSVGTAGVSVTDLAVTADIVDTMVHFRVGGRSLTDGRVQLTISGSLGTERFRKIVSFDIPGSSGASDKGASLWAFLYSEKLRITDLSGNYQRILDLGLNNHIVNSAVSLIALEPGMTLWTRDGGPQITPVKSIKAAQLPKARIAVTVASTVQFRISGGAGLKTTTLVICDLKGRVVARLRAERIGDVLIATLERGTLGKGSYVAVLKTPETSAAERFTIDR